MVDGIGILTQLASVTHQVGGWEELTWFTVFAKEMKRCFLITGFFHQGDVGEREKGDAPCSIRVREVLEAGSLILVILG